MFQKIALFCLILFNVAQATSVKMFVIYTPSHEHLFWDWFFPSFEKYNSDIELVVEKIDQTCPSATYQKTGWKDTTLQKVEMIIQAIYRT